MPRLKDDSPWGQIDYLKPIGDQGIVCVSTPSHGGYFVPTELLDRIPKRLQAQARGVSGLSNWYEEDCEWASVAISFPELFTDAQHFHAVATLMYDEGNAEWMKKFRTADLERAEAFKAANATKFFMGGGGTGGGPNRDKWCQRAYSVDGKTSLGWLEDWRDDNWKKLPDLPQPFTLEEAKTRAYDGNVHVETRSEAA